VTFGSSGRADTSDNRFIIEWEKAGSLQPANDATKNRKTIPQPLTPGKLLRKICQNIVGIDLSPLAVIAARPNYLLAPGPLLAHRGKEPLEIPSSGRLRHDALVWQHRKPFRSGQSPRLAGLRQSFNRLSHTFSSPSAGFPLVWISASW
jgi:hypothetical protein